MLYNSQGVITEFQLEVYKRLENLTEIPQLNNSLFLSHLLECDDELIHWALGEAGQELKNFVRQIDCQHPEIRSVFDEQNFAPQCVELLSIARYAREKQFNHILPSLNQLIVKNIIPQPLLRQHICLLASEAERDKARSLKKVQLIDLLNIYYKGEDFWHIQPNNFNDFLRFNVPYKEEIKQSEKKVQRYFELGCSSLADEMAAIVKILKQHVDQQYYGFNRIILTSAAVILAKSLGYHYRKNIFNDADKIVVDRQFFGTYNLTLANQSEYFFYEPKIYPLNYFDGLLSSKTKNIIKILDAFPEAGNKPIFDYFGVVVPSVKYVNDDQEYVILDERGIVQKNSRKKAILNFDTTLIEQGLFQPIIVAERDDKCYFICYFQ